MPLAAERTSKLSLKYTSSINCFPLGDPVRPRAAPAKAATSEFFLFFGAQRSALKTEHTCIKEPDLKPKMALRIQKFKNVNPLTIQRCVAACRPCIRSICNIRVRTEISRLGISGRTFLRGITNFKRGALKSNFCLHKAFLVKEPFAGFDPKSQQTK